MGELPPACPLPFSSPISLCSAEDSVPWARLWTPGEEEGAPVVCSEPYESDKFYFLRVLHSDFFYVSKKWKHFVSYKKEIFLYCAPLADHIRGVLRIEQIKYILWKYNEKRMCSQNSLRTKECSIVRNTLMLLTIFSCERLRNSPGLKKSPTSPQAP